eukprot:762326_1
MGNCAGFCQPNGDYNKSNVSDHINSTPTAQRTTQQNKTDYNNCDPSDYTKCDAMGRLINSCQQYSTLQTKKKGENYDEMLIRFMNEVYNEKGKRLIGDYIHFQKHHEHELERINHDLIDSNGFSDCSIGQCDYTKRHMLQQSATTSASDAQLSFYGDVFDGLHFHLFHCFETGLRLRVSDLQTEEEEKSKNNECFDAQLIARMRRRILERYGNTTSFDKLSINNTKFNIVNAQDEIYEKHQVNKHTGGTDTTYLDSVVKHLINSKLDHKHIKQFVQFINQQKYDTDAIENDHAIKPNGNMPSMATENQALLKHYNEYIKDTNMESSSFSIGFRFYYW